MFRKIKYIALSFFVLFFGRGYYMRHHHYVPSQVKIIEVKIKGLPKALDGLKIGHLTDIHCANYREEAHELEEAIDLLMAQKPDLVFITGDVIERHVKELTDCEQVLQKIQAPQGVFVTLGNHEYGPTHHYKGRHTVVDRINKIKEKEESFGWTLLLNENRILMIEGKQLAIIGVENYSTGSFPREGDLKKAAQGTENVDLRLLLSHDPSHWKAEVVQSDLPIALMFAGHTHGSRLKLTRGKGNPIHWYPENHGLYQAGESQLYVSSGLGNSKKFGRRFKKREVAIIILKKDDD
ncbi:MAG: metallophosphoesterase [Bacteroidota bacterium]